MDTEMKNLTLLDNFTVIPFNTTQGETVESLKWLFLLVTPIIVLVAAGNVLVIMAVCIDRKLRSSTNYFLTSLAVADLLVALTVMPPSLAMIINNYVWPFSDELCGIWVMLDVFFSTSSILHLCMISLDRYLALTRPFHYGPSRGSGSGARMGGLRYGVEKNTNFNRRVATRILVVWTIALGIAIPLPILGKQDRNNLMIDGFCAINMPEFATFGSLVAFFLPLIIMFAMYTLTIRMLRKQARLVTSMMVPHSRSSSRNYAAKRHRSSRKSKTPGVDGGAVGGEGQTYETASLMQPAKHFQGSVATDDETSLTDSLRSVLTRGYSRRSWDRCEKCGRQKNSGGQHWTKRTWRPIAKALIQVQSFAGFGGMVAAADSTADEICHKNHSKRCNCKLFERNNNDRRDRKAFFPRKFPSYGRRLSSSFKNRAMASINNEQRASKVLGLIFVLFCLFWCPFFITNVVSRFCPACDQVLMGECMNWFVWVGYVSSGVNPCVYTLFSKRFRDTFFKIVRCKTSEINKRQIRRDYSSRHENLSNASFVTFGASSKRKTSKQLSSKQVHSPPSGETVVVETKQDAFSSDSAENDVAEEKVVLQSVLYKNQPAKAARASTNKVWRSTWHAACADGGKRYRRSSQSNQNSNTGVKKPSRSKRHFSASDVDQHIRSCKTFSAIAEADAEKDCVPRPWIAQPENLTDDDSVWASGEESSSSEVWASVYDNVDNSETGPTSKKHLETEQKTESEVDLTNVTDLSEILELYDDFSDQAFLIKRRQALKREDSGMGASFEGCASLS